MPYIRRLDSGLWAATVRTPAGRITESHELQSVITKWAHDLEADIRRGEFLDPRLAKTPLAEVWEKFKNSRRLEQDSRARDESTWRVWVGPQWGKVPVGAILKPDVQTWVNELEKRDPPVGGWTIIAALNVMKAACELAVDAGLIRANPARRVRPPIAPAHEDRVLTADEELLILERLDELFPGRRDARIFIETLLDTGGRWEDIAAVRREAVNLRDGLIALGPVMKRDGTIRDYPKGARSRGNAGFRDVAVGEDLLQRLKPLVLATPPGTVVFQAPEGGHILYPTWLARVWNVALHGQPDRVLSRAPAGAYDAVRFGGWLDERKQCAGLNTDRDLARAAGIKPSLIANWRADRFGPTRGTADKLAKGLGIDPVEVYKAVGVFVPGGDGLGLADPQPTPHDMRHTFGTRLADAGVELHDRMAAMGHDDVRSGMRYTHSGAKRHDKVRAALRAARGG